MAMRAALVYFKCVDEVVGIRIDVHRFLMAFWTSAKKYAVEFDSFFYHFKNCNFAILF